jgi:hypothetical protein
MEKYLQFGLNLVGSPLFDKDFTYDLILFPIQFQDDVSQNLRPRGPAPESSYAVQEDTAQCPAVHR